MKSWMEEFRRFWRNKYYVLALAITSLFSYGFLITHATVGIDDTPYAYYFKEGLAAIVGRWVLFLLNKIVSIADFAPFLTDLAGVLLFMAGVTVWCVLLKRVFKNSIPISGYIIFACLFISNPLISEVYTYHLHNGIATGYLLTGISLCCFLEATERFHDRRPVKKVILPLLLSAISLWAAMGCYESFMMVYLAGICLTLFSARLKKQEIKVSRALCMAAGIAALAVVFRSLMVLLVTWGFGLAGMKEEAVQRSVTELLGWILQPGAFGELAMIIKRVIVMYGVFAYAYYPITIYVSASFFLILFGIWRTIRQRDGWILVLLIGSFIASYLLVLIEGKATLYRSAQFLPLFCAFGILMFLYWLQGVQGFFRSLKKLKSPKTKKRLVSVLNITAAVISVVIIWNQCADMNKWFYVDYLKYEDAKNTMNQIAYELGKNYDTGKPLVFTGNYQIPKGIIEDAYVNYNSETFFKMNRITQLLDPELLEKFYRGGYGVWVAQTPSLSVLDWGKSAFDTNEELIRFFSMHGHEFEAQTDYAVIAKAEMDSLAFPSFPREGSIVDMGDYIIIHF